MKTRLVCCFIIVVGICAMPWLTVAQETRTVLTNCNVIDCTGNPMMKDMTVVITGNRITEVSKGVYRGDKNNPNVRIFDLNGGYVLPGLWNMHSHLSDLLPDVNDILGTEPVLPAAIRAGRDAMDALRRGFTALRMVGERDYIDVAWRNAFDAGVFVGPRIYASGKIVMPAREGRRGGGGWPVELYAPGPNDFQKTMQENIDKGIDFMKIVLPGLNQDELKTAIETAHANGLRVTAHSGGMESQRAVEAGIDCIEHGTPLNDKTLQMMAEKGTFYCPTIVCNLSKEYIVERERIIGELGLDEDPEVIKGRTEVAFADERSQQVAATQREVLKKAQDLGIRVITGSDSTPLGEIGLLEIEQFVFSGLTEMQALIAATRNCADMVDRLDDLGTVEEGKIADLIVLGGNPLDHISNIRKLKMVFKDGKPVNLEKDEGLTSFWKLYFTEK